MSLLQMSLSGAVFIFLVAVIRALANDRLPRATFLILWYIALLRLLLPVSFRFPFSVYSTVSRNVPALETFGDGIVNFTGGVLPDQVGGTEAAALQAFRNSPLSVPVLPVIWAVGMAVMAGVFAVSYLRCRREFQTALPVRNDFTRAWLRDHSLWRTIDIRRLAGLSTPLAYGVLRPVILVPGDMDWGNGRQVRYVLFHEYVHIRRFDAIGKWIAAAALCVHWFNPLVWVLYIFFNRDIELSCDESVIRHFGGKNRKDYAMALIHMEEQRNRPAPFGSYFGKNATEARIRAIMKFREKKALALVSAGVLVIAGTIGVFAMAPRTGNADFGEILQGDVAFFYVSEEGIESKNIDDVPALFDPYDEYMRIWAFAVQDLDGDGNAEVILSVFGATGDMGGSLILHQAKDKVYGYMADYRALMNLKTDGTYSYSDPTGVVESGICSIAAFTETGYTADKITYGHGTYEGWDTFVVNRQPATEEEYLAAEAAQAEKPDALWYEFTDEDIQAAF